MAQIAPHRALTPLSTDCSVWLQIESGHAHEFVSFCQTSAKNNGLTNSTCLCLERAVIPKALGVEQDSCLSQFLHYKYQTQLPWMIQYATVVVHVMDYGGFGDDVV